jgi:choline dehydrogenase
VTASREAILAGGTLNLPQLLILGGIGNSGDLKQLKIPVLVNSPGVGSNMQDNEEVSIVRQFKGGELVASLDVRRRRRSTPHTTNGICS